MDGYLIEFDFKRWDLVGGWGSDNWGRGRGGWLGFRWLCTPGEGGVVGGWGSDGATCYVPDGAMYSWGRGRGGRLGMDTVEDVFEPRKIPFEFPSHQVRGLSCRHGVTMMLTVPHQH